jgi:hypothetical protein
MPRCLLAIQRRLESFYHLEAAPDVDDFVRDAPTGMREMVLVRETPEGLELAVMLPSAARFEEPGPASTIEDGLLQAIEGVSHFLFLSERARTELPTTHLELELQAEIDKFVLLALSDEGVTSAFAARLHSALYGGGRFLHAPDTEAGVRYRLANDLAARLSSRLLTHRPRARRMLQRFYRAGLSEKIRLATAA